jgi:hypothetical protein
MAIRSLRVVRLAFAKVPASDPETKNKNLLEWIEKMAAVAQPAAIYWTVRRQITKPY